MNLYLIGSESLGVRGLSCFIKLSKRSVLIDPGVALGFTRFGLHPHPLQAAFSEISKVLLTLFWRRATDVIITHFHGDHVPLYNANPFQYPLSVVRGLNRRVVIWVKEYGNFTPWERARFKSIVKCFNDRVVYISEEVKDESIEILGTYYHGLNTRTKVLAIKVCDGSQCIVHLSDTQLLVSDIIDKACSCNPKIVITDGPPLYRLKGLMKRHIAKKAMYNAMKLANCADSIIIDHHIARSIEGMKWIDLLRKEIGNRVKCAADYMKTPRMPLEAWRRVLYEVIPVHNSWFTDGSYDGFGKALDAYKDLIKELLKDIPKEVTLNELEIKEILEKITHSPK